ncbi:MAG: histidinol-phosphate transaminase [Acidobacteria bacterium]|nr:histidinol-phosphate transaminase [Acidobacteriota bacterium]MCW5971081.1 histidinol-phosphate transaminase [Blastocatellales bacterium]
MPTPLDKIKPQVRAIRAYTLAPLEAPVKINQNENPFEMPEEIKRAVLARLEDRPWSRYPTFTPTALQEKLAAHANWRADGVLAGNGSNELIQALLTVTVGAGTRVLIPEPTFTLYRQLVSVLGGEVIPVPLTEALQFNIPKLAGKVAMTKADLLILCSPNNPTGCTISERDLRLLLRQSEGLVVVDQAYVEFGGEDFAPLLPEFPNLVILRTFSKAMAMAGLRVGYLLAAPEIALEINKAKLPYNLNFFSIAAAEAALEKVHLLRPLIDRIVAERERLFAELQRIPGLSPVRSEANFFVVHTRIAPGELFEALHARGILIRDVSSYPMLAGYVRLSVGAPEENDRLIEALREIFDGYRDENQY